MRLYVQSVIICDKDPLHQKKTKYLLAAPDYMFDALNIPLRGNEKPVLYGHFYELKENVNLANKYGIVINQFDNENIPLDKLYLLEADLQNVPGSLAVAIWIFTAVLGFDIKSVTGIDSKKECGIVSAICQAAKPPVSIWADNKVVEENCRGVLKSMSGLEDWPKRVASFNAIMQTTIKDFGEIKSQDYLPCNFREHPPKNYLPGNGSNTRIERCFAGYQFTKSAKIDIFDKGYEYFEGKYALPFSSPVLLEIPAKLLPGSLCGENPKNEFIYVGLELEINRASINVHLKPIKERIVQFKVTLPDEFLKLFKFCRYLYEQGVDLRTAVSTILVNNYQSQIMVEVTGNISNCGFASKNIDEIETRFRKFDKTIYVSELGKAFQETDVTIAYKSGESESLFYVVKALEQGSVSPQKSKPSKHPRDVREWKIVSYVKDGSDNKPVRSKKDGDNLIYYTKQDQNREVWVIIEPKNGPAKFFWNKCYQLFSRFICKQLAVFSWTESGVKNLADALSEWVGNKI
ncbi:MAG: hypothetical protein ABIK38_00150 [candidate division WOR-3 bacterium]